MKPFELLFTFRGRIPRMPFFLGNVMIFAAWLVVGGGVIFVAFGMSVANETYGVDQLSRVLGVSLIALLFAFPIFLGMTYATICLAVKRLHDLGASGWFAVPLVFGGFFLLPLIFISPDVFVVVANILALVQLIGWLVLLFAPGQGHRNDYGEAFA